MGISRAALAGAGVSLLGFAAIAALGIARGVFLHDGDTAAHWLVATPRVRGETYPIQTISAAYRRVFVLERPAPAETLDLYTIERAAVWLDGEPVHFDGETEPDPRGRTRRAVALGPLAAGEHTLTVYVDASMNPPALWLRGDRLPVATDARWEYSWDGERWDAAPLAADGPQPFPRSRVFPHSARALWEMLPVLLPLFALAVVWDRRRWRVPTPGALRWGLLAFWGALAIHNIAAVSPGYGMDLRLHLDYVLYLIAERRIPLSTEGAEMMHPPLAYLIFAPLYSFFSGVLDLPHAVQALRVVTFACGAAQVELCYRAARHVYPARPDLQRVAVGVGGLLPIHLYLAHAVANEPVVGLFGGAVAVVMLVFAARDRAPAVREVALAGVLLGLALLSKVTAVLLAPALCAVVALRAWGGDRSPRRAAQRIALLSLCTALVAGGYYARNWVLLGTPFLGSWRPDFPNAWWQEPGYRSAAEYLRFGEALAHPFGAQVVGFWDGLYASFWLDAISLVRRAGAWLPPWNLTPYLATPLLALLPTALIALGALRSLRTADGQAAQRLAERAAVGAIALYLAAVLYLHLTAPFYCAAKGSYFAAATPLFAVLLASGYGALDRVPALRAPCAGVLVCWAANIAATYWVV